jgi:hypothetical protein
VISDDYLDLDLGLDAAQREELARLLDSAADRVSARGVFTAEEASAWVVLDDLAVIFRGGAEPQDTAPAAELARALAAMIRGTLPAAPPRTWWYFGPPGGRTTLEMGAHAPEDTPN